MMVMEPLNLCWDTDVLLTLPPQSMTCVKWCNTLYTWFSIDCGWYTTRRLLSSYLFAIYIDILVNKVQSCGYECYVYNTCVSILLYTDDILLLAPLVSSLQLLLDVRERELELLDVSINVKKNHRAYVLAQYLVFISVV